MALLGQLMKKNATHSIQLGGYTKESLLQAFEDYGIALNTHAKTLFESMHFEMTQSFHSLQTIEVTVEDLGFSEGATLCDIFESAKNIGLFLCPLELAPLLRLQWLDQEEGAIGKIATKNQAPAGSVTVATEVTEPSHDFPKGFYLRRIEGTLWLRGYVCDFDFVWKPEDRFLFVLPPFHLLDMAHYPRKQHFNYFRSLAYPYVGLTVNVDITDWMKVIKANHKPFFHSFLFAITRAANRVPEFRQRIEGNDIIEFMKCYSSYTVSLDNGTYCYCSIDCDMPYETFIPYAKERQEQAKLEQNLEDGESVQSLFFISSLPWLSYTNIIQPVPIPADSNPRITWGKYFEEGSKIMIPVTVLCHHALVDGIHISQFYEHLQYELKQYQK